MASLMQQGRHMWHDQEKWFTNWQYSIHIFQHKHLVHLKGYILIQTASQSNIWMQSYEQFTEVPNNVKHKNLSPLFPFNSKKKKSVFATTDSFPLIMSDVYFKLCKQTHIRDFAFFVFERTKHQPRRNLRSYIVLQRLCNEAALSPGIDAFWY